MTDDLPALERVTTNEAIAKHLHALHSARKAYIQSAHEHVRRALHSKVKASEHKFCNKDKAYYKREGVKPWLGPGKVVFQDGKVVFQD